jgi:hypothetical protein
MQEIFDQLEFRLFSYEEDSEAVVDMHRCAENLEGAWFDAPNSCRLHAKVVTRTPGSSWVVTYGNIIFAHVDMSKNPNQEGVAFAWRIHTDYRYPQVARKLLEGLKFEARKRQYKGLLIFADNSDAISDLAKIGCQPDREYSYVRTSECEQGEVLKYESIKIHPDDIARMELVPFLGSPLPAAYLNYKAVMAAEQGLFHYRRPALYEIKQQNDSYTASFDGREWHIFKKGFFKADKTIISSLLKTIDAINPARILLSASAIEAADIIPASDGVLYDYFIEL